MNIWLRRSLQTLVLTGGFVALGTGIAHADDSVKVPDAKKLSDAPALGVSKATDAAKSVLNGHGKLPVNLPAASKVTHKADAQKAPVGKHAKTTTQGHHGGGSGAVAVAKTNGDKSILGGNQVQAPVNVPVNISGNSIAVLGKSTAVSNGGHGGSGAVAAGQTSGKHSVLGGNQVQAPVNAPINVSGNSIAVLGKSTAVSNGGHGGSGAVAAGQTSGNHSVGGGNQVQAPINAPVNISGNSIAVLGKATAVSAGGHGGSGSGAVAGGQTSGNHSVAGGNQVQAPVNAPINVCGNAVAVIGKATAVCAPGQGGSGAVGGGSTSGNHSVGGGNQVQAPVNAPINVCGNAVAVIGKATAVCAPGNGGGSVGGGNTSGGGSIGGGNQVQAPINAPINVCGNAVAVIGHATAVCAPGTNGPTKPGGSTGGGGSIGGGNQVQVPINAPIDVCGNAVAVIGSATASCGVGELPPTTPPVVTPPVVVPPATGGEVGTQPVGNPPAEASPTLPVTGSSAGLVAGLGGLLTIAGGGLALAGRRRRQSA